MDFTLEQGALRAQGGPFFTDFVLLPGETDDVMWASFGKVNWMIRTGKICKIIGHQFRRQEKQLRLRNMPKFGR